jgi:1-aminocyclopropane-1-carboxylate deaminase
MHDYHFGGYAKHTKELIHFMNDWYRQTGVPSDFVYTGKLFFAVYQLLQQNYFAPGSTILVIHSGGLQGNRSLPKGTLIF